MAFRRADSATQARLNGVSRGTGVIAAWAKGWYPRGTSIPMSVTCGFAYLDHTGKHITAGQGLVCVSEARVHRNTNAS
jgi:hypothetical protein